MTTDYRQEKGTKCLASTPHDAILNFRLPHFPPSTKLTIGTKTAEMIFLTDAHHSLNIVCGGKGCRQKTEVKFCGVLFALHMAWTLMGICFVETCDAR